MKRAVLDFWVGLFILIGIVSIVFLSLRVANQTSIRGAETYKISAEFDNIGGLKMRAPVKSSGVIIGRVVDVYLDADTHKAVVAMELETRYQFSMDTSASILTSGLLGEQYISLQTGGEEEMLSDGDSIWLTSSAIILESLVSELLFSEANKTKP